MKNQSQLWAEKKNQEEKQVGSNGKIQYWSKLCLDYWTLEKQSGSEDRKFSSGSPLWVKGHSETR